MTGRTPLGPARVSAALKLRRACWNVAWLLLYRFSPTPLFAWRRLVLRTFGARIGAPAWPYPRVRVWAPWNLSMAPYSCLANDVDCYCVAAVSLAEHVTVSQYSYLCTASHDVRDPAMPLVVAPIRIERDAWIAADVFVGPGVRVGTGAVIAARATITRDIAPWSIQAGNPAREIGTRPSFERGPDGAPC